MSIIVLFVVVPYGFSKFLIMREYDDTDFQSITLENEIDERLEFSYEQTHLNVMFYFMYHNH